MGSPFDLTGSHGQNGLGPIQGLDLGLLSTHKTIALSGGLR